MTARKSDPTGRYPPIPKWVHSGNKGGRKLHLHLIVGTGPVPDWDSMARSKLADKAARAAMLRAMQPHERDKLVTRPKIGFQLRRLPGVRR